MTFRRGSEAEVWSSVCNTCLGLMLVVLLTLGWLPSWDNIKDTAERDSVRGVSLSGESHVVTWTPSAWMDAEFRPNVRGCRALITRPRLHALKACPPFSIPARY